MQEAVGEKVWMNTDTADPIQAQPLVTVIMPAYNAEKYIAAAISSVLSQSYGELELLVIDDCSSDKSVEIAESFGQSDPRVKVLRNARNVGVARTRNRGLDMARGEWIALLDSDDIWRQDKLEKQLEIAAKSRADIIYCSYSLMDENGGHLSDFIVPETTSYNNMLRESVLSCSTVLMHRRLLSHRFSEKYCHEDYVFWLELLKAGYSAVASREILADYRIVSGSRSNDKLKAAKGRWLIYREVENLSLIRAVSVFVSYALHGLVKHRRV